MEGKSRKRRHGARRHGAGASALHGQQFVPPVAIISGGETTVTVRGKGRGGRNAEFLLPWRMALDGAAGNSRASPATRTGSTAPRTTPARSWTPDSFSRAQKAGVDLKALFANDDYTAFEKLGDLIVTGATRTNVNDFRVILVPKRV